jgi:putative endonuclease
MTAASRGDDGRAAETLAADHLRAKGLAILERNVRSRHGEIDLIARDGATLVFVEVRLRRPGRHGGAADSISAAKRRRLVAAAREYHAHLPRTPECRFDAVLLDDLDAGRIEWIRNAIEDAG